MDSQSKIYDFNKTQWTVNKLMKSTGLHGSSFSKRKEYSFPQENATHVNTENPR